MRRALATNGKMSQHNSHLHRSEWLHNSSLAGERFQESEYSVVLFVHRCKTKF
jgi:hypothetical protein